MVSNLTELAGFGLVIGFLWFVWPPLVLLGAGVLLIVSANVRTAAPARRGAAVGAAAGAAWSAARSAYRLQREQAAVTRELRRVG